MFSVLAVPTFSLSYALISRSGVVVLSHVSSFPSSDTASAPLSTTDSGLCGSKRRNNAAIATTPKIIADAIALFFAIFFLFPHAIDTILFSWASLLRRDVCVDL